MYSREEIKCEEFTMATTALTIRIDSELKREAAEIADYCGLDLSTVTRAFYKQMVNTRRIPLTFAPEEPNEETLRAIAEGEKILAQGGTGRSFASGRALIDAALFLQKWSYYGLVFAIEVKAEENLRAKSLRSFKRSHPEINSVRFSLSGYCEQGWMRNIPLYAVSNMELWG